jgi:hypothetical protein
VEDVMKQRVAHAMKAVTNRASHLHPQSPRFLAAADVDEAHHGHGVTERKLSDEMATLEADGISDMSDDEQFVHKESLLRMDASSQDGKDRRRLGLANPVAAFVAPQALNVSNSDYIRTPWLNGEHAETWSNFLEPIEYPGKV